jgi:FdhD protein
MNAWSACTATIDGGAEAAQVFAMLPVPPPVVSVERRIWRGEAATSGTRIIPEETPIALTYGRTTHAVMMATPADLEDFALGFSLAEGIVQDPAEIQSLDVVVVEDGIELRMDLTAARQTGLARRQRRITGPGGCGLCGMDSLAEALRPAPPVAAEVAFTPSQIEAALASMPEAQTLNARTRAVHAAAFWTPGSGLLALREDVGRHNALDKLLGAMAAAGHRAVEGIVLLSSRVSVEMVQKAAVLGAPILVAVSAPTALAVRTADTAGMTLIGIGRTDAFEVFTHPNRIQTEPVRHVA